MINRYFFSALLLITAGLCKAQTVLTPGNIPFETKWLKNGRVEMGVYSLDGGSQTEISTFAMDINADNKTLSIFTYMKLMGMDEPWIDTSIADGTTFKPIYRSSYSINKEMRLKYGKDVTGYYYDKKSGKKTVVKDAVKETFLDSYTYPYLLGLLPLTSGYSASLPVYDFKPENDGNVKKSVIEEVKSGMYVSEYYGSRKVWLVNVLEEATNDRYIYSIDKDNRRLWKVEIFANGQHLLMVDKEIDYNPIKSSFDKVATLKMIKSGSAVISGQVFAKDNENEGLMSKMAVLNVNKKQFPREGTTIVLIPYTDYFKEWMKLNESLRKKGRSYPMPKDVADCIKTTTVYDDKGHFEFVNLMPGDYMLYTEFGYTHTTRRTEVTGYTDTYINGLYQGTRTNTVSRAYGQSASASIKRVVSIDKEGEKVETKLKKTL